MNVDLKTMERDAEDMRAQMRDVLTRKLGKPRKVKKLPLYSKKDTIK